MYIYIPNTPIARPPRAIPMAWPLSSSSVYTLASIPIPENTDYASLFDIPPDANSKSGQQEL